MFAVAPPVLIQPDSGAILQPGATLNVAPRELVFTFTGVPGLDRTTLGGIMLQHRAATECWATRVIFRSLPAIWILATRAPKW